MNELVEFYQYDSIPYAGDYECPECGSNSMLFGTLSPKLAGWCCTPNGYMMVFECQECFTKFRYHNMNRMDAHDWNKFKYVMENKYINSTI